MVDLTFWSIVWKGEMESILSMFICHPLTYERALLFRFEESCHHQLSSCYLGQGDFFFQLSTRKEINHVWGKKRVFLNQEEMENLAGSKLHVRFTVQY